MKPILTILFLFISTLTLAQSKPFKATPTQTAALKKQADGYAAAVMKQDFKQMVYYTYPPLVKKAGDPAKMEKQITTAMGQMQAQGISFSSVSIGEIKDIVQSKGDLYSLIQNILQISMNGSVVTSSSYLLAYSHDNGKRWYFVNAGIMKNQSMKSLFPTYPPGMVIPQTNNPMMGN